MIITREMELAQAELDKRQRDLARLAAAGLVGVVRENGKLKVSEIHTTAIVLYLTRYYGADAEVKVLE